MLATVALGYADGLMRAIGNRGQAAISGRRVPIVGRVSMDLTTLDVSGIPPELVTPETEAEFFGDTITLEDAAKAGDTVPYEILTALSPRVPRCYEAASE